MATTTDLDMSDVMNESRSEKLEMLLMECIESGLGCGGSERRELATRIRLRELQIVILELNQKPLENLLCNPDGT